MEPGPENAWQSGKSSWYWVWLEVEETVEWGGVCGENRVRVGDVKRQEEGRIKGWERIAERRGGDGIPSAHLSILVL